MEQNNSSKHNNNGNNRKGGNKHFGGRRRPHHHRNNNNNRDANNQVKPAREIKSEEAINESVQKTEITAPSVFSDIDYVLFPNDKPIDDKPKYTFTEEELDEVIREKEPVVDDRPKTEVVGIRFRKVGKMYYFSPNGITAKTGMAAIVETARGTEYGEVCKGNHQVPTDNIVQPLRPLLRLATEADVAHNKENIEKETEAFRICIEKIAVHQLDMKLVDVQYTFDNSKLVFYFTSAGRVDFRELVKDLASIFRTRIELRQIGIRDEAKLMGGLGICGRPLCCASFLSDFVQVSIKMAKEQSLSLNSAKISGACGRLMCCLRYEYDTYQAEIARTPPVDSVVETPDGIGTVLEMSPLVGTVKVKLNDKQDSVIKVYKRELCKIISKPAPTEENNK